MQTDLATYLAEEGMPIAKFAERLGVRKMTVYRYISKDRVPRPSIMRRIVEETNGRVTPDSFFAPKQDKAA